MKSWSTILGFILGLFAFAVASHVAAADANAPARPFVQPVHPAVSLVQTIPLPDVPGVFNQMAVDPVRGLLIATAVTARSLTVIDLKAGRQLRAIPDNRPASVILAEDCNELIAGHGHEIVIYNATNYAAVGRIDLQTAVNEIQYDPVSHRIYAACQNLDHAGMAIIDAPARKLLGFIKLPPKPMGFVRERHGDCIFVNIPTVKQLAVLDSAKQTVLAVWPLNDMEGNYPIALDESNHRLFVGCRKPAQLAVFDTTNGRLVAKPQICGDVDNIFYDAPRKRLYLSGGEGYLDVVQQSDPDTYALVDRIPTAAGARNCLYSPELDRVFVAIPQRDNPISQIRVFQPQQ